MVIGRAAGIAAFRKAMAGDKLLPQSLRLFLGVGFILLGWGVSGALLVGSVLAGLGAFLLGWWWLRDVHSGSSATEAKRLDEPSLRDELSRFSVIVVLSMLGFMVLMNIDTIAIKSRFLPLEAGLYSAMATIGRVVFYISAAVVTFMFPRVAGQHAQGLPTITIARRALLVTFVLCVLGVLFFSIRPDLIMRVLFGQHFLGEAALLVPYSIAMLLLALVNVWMLYFLAVQETRYTVFLLTGAFTLLVLLFALPISLRGVIWAMTICFGALVLGGEWLLRRKSD